MFQDVYLIVSFTLIGVAIGLYTILSNPAVFLILAVVALSAYTLRFFFTPLVTSFTVFAAGIVLADIVLLKPQSISELFTNLFPPEPHAYLMDSPLFPYAHLVAVLTVATIIAMAVIAGLLTSRRYHTRRKRSTHRPIT